MPFLSVRLTPSEKRLLRQWHESMLDSHGHYGDGAAMFPDEERTLEKLRTPGDGEIAFTEVQVRLLLDWGESATRGMVAVDEDRLLGKLREALAQE